MFKNNFDMNVLLNNGHFVTQLEDQRILLLIENFLNNINENDYLNNSHLLEKDVNTEWCSRKMYNNSNKIIEKMLKPHIKKYMNPWLKYLTNDINNLVINLNIFKCMNGYEMSWHNDMQGGENFFLLYMYSDKNKKITSGKVQIAKITKDLEGNTIPESYNNVISELIPQHGNIVILDNRNPLFEHKIFQYNEENIFRYLLMFSIEFKNNQYEKSKYKI